MESIMKETEFRIETFRYNNFFFKHKKRWKNGFLNSWLQERQLLPVILRVHLCILVCKDLFFHYTYKNWAGSPIKLGMTSYFILDKRFRRWQMQRSFSVCVQTPHFVNATEFIILRNFILSYLKNLILSKYKSTLKTA